VPLSHEEQRVLEEMERELCADDPRFVQRITRRRRRIGRVLSIAMLAFCCGFALLVVGIVGRSVVGVVLALIGLVTVTASCFAMIFIHERRWFRRSFRRHWN
jgi:hypothetical protein